MKFINCLCAIILALFATVALAQTIDINTATAEQLEKALKGIGPKKAAEIVKYREANGPFKSVEDLVKVPGVGEKTVAANKELLTTGGAAMPSAPAAPSMPAVPKAPAMPAVPTAPVVPPVPATPPAAPPKQ